jgi:hypothetical protein
VSPESGRGVGLDEEGTADPEFDGQAANSGFDQNTQDSLVKTVSPWVDTSPASDVPRW